MKIPCVSGVFLFYQEVSNGIICIMAVQKKSKQKPSLQSIYIHHIAWGAVCLGLITILLGMWYQIQTLNRANATLEREVSTQTVEASCTARDTWESNTTKTFSTLTSDGTREYSVHLPDKFNPSRYYPLIVHFPGKGANAFNGAKQAGLNVLNAVVVYPHPTVGKDGYNAWQGAPYSSGVDDVAFTSAVLDKVQSQLCIEREHVYATGMSNGGGMVSLLSCELSDRFAAFGIVAGAMYYPDGGCKPSQPTPIISIHGDGDINVPYTGSLTRRLPDIATWSAARAQDNGCNPTPTITNTDATTTVTTWNKCENGATVQNVRLRGGGHLWYPEATQTVWQFLSRHSL
jgi:polyhydroxybutyrate depolymerase